MGLLPEGLSAPSDNNAETLCHCCCDPLCKFWINEYFPYLFHQLEVVVLPPLRNELNDFFDKLSKQ